MAIGLYGLLLAAVFVAGSPWWAARMVGSGRYRAGLWGRLGRVPRELRAAVAGRQVVWVHAVSVGEVLAASRLVAELGEGLGDGWVICVSTTTETGQRLARERFGAARVFWYPLDFGWAVRAYLRALRPRLVVLMESELWPRMLVECGRRGIPVVVVNARVSDRSFARGMRVRAVWGRVLRKVTIFLAQSEEDGRRLEAMGAGSVRVVGNLKFDVRAPRESRVAELIREAAGGRPVVVAGSTSEDPGGSEEAMVLRAWSGARRERGAMLVLAPRHPERFGYARTVAGEFACVSASELPAGEADVVVLDTVGDLAAVYGVADVAFVGGSLVKRGGHNPLEPAQFGVPVVMGPSYENFRDVVGKMRAVDGIRVVRDEAELQRVLVELLRDSEAARALGARGRAVFEAEQGATGRVVGILVGLVKQ